MLKVKFKLIISEIEINEEYVGRKRNDEENIIEKEFDINEGEDIVLYEGLKDDEDIIERMEIAYELNKKEKMFKQRHGRNMTVCYGCTMMINIEKEKEELLLIGKEFRSYCIDCEKEELDITDSELNYKDDNDDIEIVNETLQEESSNNESETSINGESSDKRKRKRKIKKEVNNTEKGDKRKKIRIEDEESTEEEEILENETEAFEKLVKDLSTPVLEEQLIEEGNIGNMTLEKLFMKAVQESQGLVRYWYDVGEEFRKEIREKKGSRIKKERDIRSNIYNRMERNLKGHSRKTIMIRLARAERVYRIFKGIGGKQKISRMRNTCMNTIIKLRKEEVDELIRRVNEIEEERNSIMEE
ncbi:unnamed protein product [Rhizophagus irregularis]|nr:unnamed protein product [Rhizophagus irregularis]